VRTLTAEDFKHYEERGYIHLGKVATDAQLVELKDRMDDMMLGRLVLEGRFFQRDSSSGEYKDVDAKDVNYSGPTLAYRKVKDLEYDEAYLKLIQNPVFRQLSETLIGPASTCMRAMLMNKPANSKVLLPYHQDISDGWNMSRPPVFTIWMALDPATKANGCMEIVPGSHKAGRIGTGHIVTPEDEAKHAPAGSSKFMELAPGEAFVFHNGTLHRSGANATDQPRRGFTLCLLHPDTKNMKSGKTYPLVFGPGALTPESVRGLKAVPSHVYDKK
jgi:phytanoyl-CoA hydroxylase